MKPHSFWNGSYSSAQLFYFGQVPLKSNWATRAPYSSAIEIEPSALCESTTKISSAHFTQSRQRGRLPASFLIGIRTDTGTLDASVIQSALSADNRAPRAHRSRDRRVEEARRARLRLDRKSTRLNSSHLVISYAVFC